MGRELSFAPDFVMRTELMDKLRELYELFDNISDFAYVVEKLDPFIPEPVEPLLSVEATFSRNRKLGNLPMDEVVTVLHNLARTKDPKGLKMLSDICAMAMLSCSYDAVESLRETREDHFKTSKEEYRRHQKLCHLQSQDMDKLVEHGVRDLYAIVEKSFDPFKYDIYQDILISKLKHPSDDTFYGTGLEWEGRDKWFSSIDVDKEVEKLISNPLSDLISIPAQVAFIKEF